MTGSQHANSSYLTKAQPSVPLLPTEIWLQILEQKDEIGVMYLWNTVRLVSRQLRDCVERLFRSIHLPQFTFSLTLPRRDPTTGTMNWPGPPIVRSGLVFSFDRITPDSQRIVLKTPTELSEGSEIQNVAELKNSSILPKERMEAAPPWVVFGKKYLTGLSMTVPATVEWDSERDIWTWTVKWKPLVCQFFRAKEKKGLRAQPFLTR